MRNLELQSSHRPQSVSASSHEYDDDSDEEQSLLEDGRGVHRGRGIMYVAMATAAIVGLLFSFSAFYFPAKTAVAAKRRHEENEAMNPRLLQSDEFVNTAAKHTIALHKELGLPMDELDEGTRAKLHEELTKEARLQLHHLVDLVEATDPEAARKLRDVKITQEQWGHTHRLLAALHDKRVHNVGEDAMKAASGARDEESATAAARARLESRNGEMRRLADELIPPEVRNAPHAGVPYLEMTINQREGQVKERVALGDWHAVLEVQTNAHPDYPQQTGERRLQNAPSVTGVPGWLVTTLRGLYVSVGVFVATLVGLITTLLTAIVGSRGAKAIWWVLMGFSSAECATQLGLSLGIPDLRGWYQWIPCWIMSAFTGLEAIWTFTK